MINMAAIEDGIKTCRDGRGHIVYLIPCAVCGSEVPKKAYWRNNVCLCGYCKGKVKKKTEQHISNSVLTTETKAEKRFNEAVKCIEKQVGNFGEYQKPIEIARTRLEQYGSIPEAMVAIELIRLKYSIIPQQKVNKYKVDFAIPKHKIVVEVDGKTYHHEKSENEREATIQLSLGLDWKIIHIPAEYIKEDIQKLIKIMDMYIK